MKLKLETQDSVTILVVTERIESSHIPILKAGMAKLIQSGKKAILLDFTAVTEKDFAEPALLQQVADLRAWGSEAQAQVVVASAISAVGHTANRADGLKLMASPSDSLLSQENALKAKCEVLEKQKAEMTAKLSAGESTELKKVQLEGSTLKRNIKHVEQISRSLLKLRKQPPVKTPALQMNQEKLAELLNSLLTQEGVIS